MINSMIHAIKELAMAGKCCEALSLLSLGLLKISRTNAYKENNKEIVSMYKRLQKLGRFLRYLINGDKANADVDASTSTSTNATVVKPIIVNASGIQVQGKGCSCSYPTACNCQGPSGASTQTGTFYSV